MLSYRQVAVQPILIPVPVSGDSWQSAVCLEMSRSGFYSFSSENVTSLPVTGSGSGASFYSLESNDARYVIKIAFGGSPRKRVQEEMGAYKILQEKPWTLPYLTPLLLEKTSFSCLVLPFLEGKCTSEVVRWDTGKEIYRDIFAQGIGGLLTLYKDTCRVCPNPIAWFNEKTISYVLDPLKNQKEFLEDRRLSGLLINGVPISNCIPFFESLGGHGDYLIPQDLREAIQLVLSPRYMAEVPTDPNTLNEMAVIKDGKLTVHWIDPGRVEDAQLAYPLIKHEGMFAHVLPYILQNELVVHLETPGNYAISLQDVTLSDGFLRSKSLHGLSEVMARLESHPSGKILVENRPFFKMGLLQNRV